MINDVLNLCWNNVGLCDVWGDSWCIHLTERNIVTTTKAGQRFRCRSVSMHEWRGYRPRTACARSGSLRHTGAAYWFTAAGKRADHQTLSASGNHSGLLGGIRIGHGIAP